MRLVTWVWRVLRALLLALAAIWLLVEEWGWRPLAAWLGRFARWPPWARTEARIASLPPRSALLVFLVPVVFLLPVKLLAVSLLHTGHAALGLGVVVAAKLIGTAISGRLFVLTEPQLMQLPRFAQVVRWWRGVRYALHEWSRWRAMRAALRLWRQRLRRLVQR